MYKINWKLIFTAETFIIFIMVLCILNKAGILFKGINTACAANFDSPCINNIDIGFVNKPIVDNTVENKINNIVSAMVEDVEEEDKEDNNLNNISIEEKYRNKIKKIYSTNVTSYNSEIAQTDSSPCITASGLNICERGVEDIVAANDLPLHTKILIPEYFGEKIFYVEDRMNVRYTGTGRIDIWMRDKDNSKQWGVKYTKIIVLK